MGENVFDFVANSHQFLLETCKKVTKNTWNIYVEPNFNFIVDLVKIHGHCCNISNSISIGNWKFYKTPNTNTWKNACYYAFSNHITNLCKKCVQAIGAYSSPFSSKTLEHVKKHLWKSIMVNHASIPLQIYWKCMVVVTWWN